MIHQPRKSRTLYVLLAWFFGYIGIHNFYAGRIRAGFVQLAISVISCGTLCFVSELWSIVEIFVIDTDGRGVAMKPLRTLAALVIILLSSVLPIAAATAASMFGDLSFRPHTRALCSANLKKLGTEMRTFINDHQKELPKDLSDLRRADDTGDITRCPESHVKYIYIGRGLTDSAAGFAPVVFELPGAHRLKGRPFINVLFLDGHVEGIILPHGDMPADEIAEYLIRGRQLDTKTTNILLDNAVMEQRRQR